MLVATKSRATEGAKKQKKATHVRKKKKMTKEHKQNTPVTVVGVISPKVTVTCVGWEILVGLFD